MIATRSRPLAAAPAGKAPSAAKATAPLMASRRVNDVSDTGLSMAETPGLPDAARLGRRRGVDHADRRREFLCPRLDPGRPRRLLQCPAGRVPGQRRKPAR